jgi:hypothetical protein
MVRRLNCDLEPLAVGSKNDVPATLSGVETLNKNICLSLVAMCGSEVRGLVLRGAS